MKENTLPSRCAPVAPPAPHHHLAENAVSSAAGGGVARCSTLFASVGTSLLTLVLAIIMSSVPIMGWGQAPCFPTCSVTGYKCILASSNYFSPTPIGNLIGSGVNQLTPMPNAGTTQQEVVIKGWIEVNSNYTFATGSDIVFADSESGFIVSEGATLTFKASNPPFSLTTLHGCSLMWGGIFVRANSTVVLENQCEVYDAYSAINLYHNSKVVSTGTKYFGNYTCISADRVEGDPATINVTASLTGNEFDGDGFLAPYKGANLGRPHHAIIANYVNQFSIGAAGTNIPKNVFKRFQPTASGLQIIPVVASFNTNLTVRNSTFEDIGDFSSIAFETPNIGIWASSDNSKTFTLDVKGIFKFGEPTFKNVYKGIECYGTCLKVDQCTFDNGINHILVQPANTPISPQVSPALSYSITNSTFGRFIQAAISAQGVFPAQKFVVSNNTFIDNTSISPGGSTAAEFLSKSPLTSHLSIKENTVTKTSDVFASGFVLEGVAEAFVGNNTFTNLSSTSSVALIFNSAHRGIAKENSFSGINDIGDTESGLKVFNSFGTKALCNDFDQLGQGMRFEGNGCDGSILFNNKFGSHNFAGIYLPDFTTIGQQPAYANEWPNTSTTDEARFELDPLDPNWNDKLDASKFIIPIPEAVNPDLWAQPRYPEGNAWFIYENIVQSELCSVYGEAPSDDDMGLTATDAMVLSGTHPNYGGYPATTWDAQLRLYGRLHIRPDLRPASSSADSFYTSNQNAPFARLAVALEQYRQAIAPDATLNQQLGAYYAQVDSLNLLIADADSVIAAGGSISATLWQMRSAHVQALDLVSQLATAALNAFATSRNATLSTLQTTVNSIGTAQTWETNLKSALGILLTGPQASPAWTWTSMQNSTLESIAAQCAHEGGYGVILARLMLGDNAPNDDNCFNQQRTASRSGSVGKSLLRVYPNPTTGLLHILDAGEGRLLVRDQTGRTVLEQLASGSPLTVDLSTLPQGLYFLQVVSGAQSSATHKVFLNR